MLQTMLFALTVSFGGLPATCPIGVGPARGALPAGSEELRQLYESGVPFADFLADADRRKEMWHDHYEGGDVSEPLLERARRIEGSWRILAIAEDWCSDSVNTIPFLALLVERVPGIEMRVIDSERGRALMEAHRTPDDRAATPTIIILDEAYEERGCWVERPADLQAWAMAERKDLSDRQFLDRKFAWYDADGGESTVREVIEVVEAAAAGSRICGQSR